jgi:hypothetical protein
MELLSNRHGIALVAPSFPLPFMFHNPVIAMEFTVVD